MARPSQAKENLIKAAYDLIWETSYGSTSVDDICARAGVRKGSFYHFFESKAHLTIATLDAGRAKHFPELNEIFSPLVPPLERFVRFAGYVLFYQQERLALTGHVCGCALSSLGSEVGSMDELIRNHIIDIFSSHLRYYESAIRDAAREGLIDGTDAPLKAKMIQHYVQGALTHARVLNDLTPVHEMARSMLHILGAKPDLVPSLS